MALLFFGTYVETMRSALHIPNRNSLVGYLLCLPFDDRDPALELYFDKKKDKVGEICFHKHCVHLDPVRETRICSYGPENQRVYEPVIDLFKDRGNADTICQNMEALIRQFSPASFANLINQMATLIKSDNRLSLTARDMLLKGSESRDEEKWIQFLIATLQYAIEADAKPPTSLRLFKSYFPTVTKETPLMEKELDKLGKNFTDDHLQLLIGPDGIGKTTLALQFVRKTLKKYKSIWWIDCSSEASKLASCRSFLSINDPDYQSEMEDADIVPVFADVLDGLNFWLLVYDNCTFVTEEDWRQFTADLPRSYGNKRDILVISDTNLVCDGVPHIELSLYAMQDGELDALSPERRAALQDGLHIAIAKTIASAAVDGEDFQAEITRFLHVIACMGNEEIPFAWFQEENWSNSAYPPDQNVYNAHQPRDWSSLEDDPNEFFYARFGPEDQPEIGAARYRIFREKLIESDIQAEIDNHRKINAMYQGKAINFFDPACQKKILATLTRYFLAPKGKNDTVSLHPLVSEIVREDLKSTGTLCKTLTEALRLTVTNLPYTVVEAMFFAEMNRINQTEAHGQPKVEFMMIEEPYKSLLDHLICIERILTLIQANYDSSLQTVFFPLRYSEIQALLDTIGLCKTILADLPSAENALRDADKLSRFLLIRPILPSDPWYLLYSHAFLLDILCYHYQDFEVTSKFTTRRGQAYRALEIYAATSGRLHLYDKDRTKPASIIALAVDPAPMSADTIPQRESSTDKPDPSHPA